MDQKTAELCAEQLLANGCDRADVRPVEGVQLEPGNYENYLFEQGRGRYEVVVYLHADDGDLALFSVQAYTPLYQGDWPVA